MQGSSGGAFLEGEAGGPWKAAASVGIGSSRQGSIFEVNHRRYGYRRIFAAVGGQQVFVSEKVVRLLTRREGLAAATSRRRRYGSYLGEIGLGPENLIDHNFRSAAPDESGLPTLRSSTFRAATCIYRMRSTASMGSLSAGQSAHSRTSNS